jgi:RimJ/RimL family protein N-acetyltransferase
MPAFLSNEQQWRRHLVLGDGSLVSARPVRPGDDVLIRELLVHVSKEDLRLRFFDSIKEFSDQFIAKLTKVDDTRAMTIVATDEAGTAMLGAVWLYADLVRETAEYAVLLRSDYKGRGLGWALMQLMIEYAKFMGLKRIDGQILQENSVMLKMCRELGFEIKADAEDHGLCDVTLTLRHAK